VYILGTGSLANDEEIRYSVRSLEQNMLDLGRVFVVGEKPGPLPGAAHVPASDVGDRKWQRAYLKIKKACALPDLSADFLLMNDDFFMLEPFHGSEWPFYAVRNGNGGPCGPVDFSIHCPILLNKELYANMPFSADQKGHLSPRTFYGNFYRVPAVPTSDFILRAGAGCRPFDEQVIGWRCFSVSDSAMLDLNFKNWLDSLYPNPSRFE
jgi:hypothetical protein